ncbi:iron-hydroxamate ABC transporter substrate-binding protein [Alkalicoccobacillus porphyridii]|uniref:iron-hydroxamate ABC transporter substrate-binding protein n=1 Tax=Alkalicoccobacillus porphyridii TaxID=2597270 RepID=UPI003F684868
MHKQLSLLGITLAALLFVSACNSNSENTQGDEQAETKTFQSVSGDVEIPAKSERIVTDIYAGEFLSVGANVVGAGSWIFGNPTLKEQLSEVTDIGDPVNVESVLELDPDLIVVMSDEHYEELSQIAPTIVIPYNTTTNIQDTVEMFGELAGAQEQAANFIQDFEEKAAQAKEEISGVIAKDATVGIYEITDTGSFWVFTDNGGRGGQALYNALDLDAPEIIQSEIIDTGEVKELSLEVVPDFAADYMFITDYNPDGTSDSLDTMESSAIWQDLDAVQNNRVFINDFDTFYPYDPISVSHQIDLFVKMIQERSEENGE